MNSIMNFSRMTILYVLSLLIFTGCSATLETVHSEISPELNSVELQKTRLVINNTEPGTAASNGRLYALSGIYLSNCIKDIVTNFNPSVKLMNKVLTEDEILVKLRENKDIDYLIFAEINNWEDHATEWNFVPDLIDIDIKLIEVNSGKIMARENFKSRSKIATFGGDHPQDMLAYPLGNIFKKWFGKDITIIPDDYPCETKKLQSDY